MGARRGKRSAESKAARQHATYLRDVDHSIRVVDRERRADIAHDRRTLAAGIRGVGIVTRGMAAPDVASVTRAPVGQWQAMSPDAPVSLSDERAAAYVRDRRRERAATAASNRLLASMREVDRIEGMADAMRDQ